MLAVGREQPDSRKDAKTRREMFLASILMFFCHFHLPLPVPVFLRHFHFLLPFHLSFVIPTFFCHSGAGRNLPALSHTQKRGGGYLVTDEKLCISRYHKLK